MKRSFIKAGIVALALSILQPCSLQAQLVYSALADNAWYTSSGSFAAGVITGINTAMIDFNNPTIGAGTLMVSDYTGNGTPGGVVFTDQGSGFTVQIPYDAGSVPNYYINGSPDIIVGNDAANPSTDYRVAVAYICNYTGIPVTLHPQIDYWGVHYTGPGAFTVQYICSTFFSSIANPSTIHIDIIAEHGNTSATGFPWCDSFKVVLDDIPMPTTANVYGYSGSLNGPLCDPATPLFLFAGMQPDVAAIQRQILLPPSIDNIALIAYTDVTSSTLYYAEWDVTAGTVGAYTTLDYGGITGKSYSYPRIDAPDDYTINNPSIPLRSYYKAAVQTEDLGTTTFTSNSYDNQTVGGPAFPTYPPGTPDEYAPTVAFGGNNNTQYQVAHNSNDNSLFPTYPRVNTFMEPIPWGNPYIIAPSPLLAPNYFLVNLTAFNPTINYAAGTNLTAISTPCNNTGHETLVAWTYYDLSVTYSTVWYKTTQYGPPNGYAFRQAGAAGVSNVTLKDWNVYPNPATTMLTIDNPVTDGARYEITDIPGRIVLNGSLPAGTQTIDANILTPGTYIISLYEGDKRDYTKVFVKQ